MTTPEAEWQRFFDEIYLESYADRLSSFDDVAEARAAIELAEFVPPAGVLDCPCGFGRHAVPLADLGYSVVGADRSQVMLDGARELAGARDSLSFVAADFRRLPFESATFDAVLNLFSSLGYYGEDADRETLREFRRVLRAGGVLVAELMHRDRLMSVFREREWDELPNGGLVLESRSFDHVEGVVETSHELIRSNGERLGFRFRIRVYTATELRSLLIGAGFASVAFFGGLVEREPPSARRRLVAVARVS